MTNAATVSASKRRETIPAAELMGLEEMTSEELAWRGDNHVDPDRRAWSRWELAYRDALGVHVDISPAGRLRRGNATDDYVHQLEGERSAAAAAERAGVSRKAMLARPAIAAPDVRPCEGCGAVQSWDECLACMDDRLGIVRDVAPAV